jgi:hypothetical protein
VVHDRMGDGTPDQERLSTTNGDPKAPVVVSLCLRQPGMATTAGVVRDAGYRAEAALRAGARLVAVLRAGARFAAVLRAGARLAAVLRAGARLAAVLRAGARLAAVLRAGARLVAFFAAVLRAGARLAVVLRTAFFTALLAVVFLALTFLTAFLTAFLAVVFLAATLRAAVLRAGAFLAALLRAAVLRAGAFLAVLLRAAVLRAGAFLAAAFFLVAFFTAMGAPSLGFNADLNVEPVANRTPFDAGIGTTAPVRGFLPIRAARRIGLKVPNPMTDTFLPERTSAMIVSNKTSTTSSTTRRL